MIRRISLPLIVLGFLSAGLRAEPPPDKMLAKLLEVSIQKVEVGFGGQYKVGDWAPLFVTLEATQPTTVRLVVEATDPDDNITLLPSAEQKLEAEGPQRLQTYFKSGRLTGDLHVRVYSGEHLLASDRYRPNTAPGSPLRPALMQSVALWATLGKPGGFDDRPDVAPVQVSNSPGGIGKPVAPTSVPSREIREAPLESALQLPDEWRGYQTLEGLCICCSAAGPDGKLLISQLTDRQDAAIREWVQSGGHLVLSVGKEVPAYQASPFAKWVPVPVEGQTQTRQLNRLERYLGRPAPIFRKFNGTVPVARLGAGTTST